jgi:hypothetical protein
MKQCFVLRREFFFGFIFSLSFAAVTAQADEWKSTLHGDVEFDSTNYAQSIAPTNQFLESTNGALDESIRYGKNFRIKLDPVAQADPLNHSDSERYWFDLPQGYAQYQSSGWTFQGGYNTYTWGVTDGYNPLDVVSARRYEDPLNAQKLGAFSTSIKKDWGSFSIEGIYIPHQRSSVLPGNNSRWLPREVFTTTSVSNGTQSATLNLPPDVDYSFSPQAERDGALENNFGFRAQFSGLVSGLDASLEAFEGAGATPAIDVTASGNVTQLQPSVVIQADPNIALTPVYYRQRMYGGSLVYANFGMIFRTEVAITRLISTGIDLPGNSEEYILGIERAITIADKDLTVLLQGTHARHDQALTDSTVSLYRIFDRAVILGLRYAFSEKLTVLGSGLLDTESHGSLTHLEASYALTDDWKLGLAGDILQGANYTPIGTYHENDRLIASAKYSF